MNAEIHQLKPKPLSVNWMCSSCGVDAGCNCGAPMMSKAQRAAEAIASNPQMSDRAIAQETGISQPTISKARKATDNLLSVHEPRIGLDGKQRRMPTKRIDAEDDEEELVAATPSERRSSFLIFSNEAMLMAQYQGPIDIEIRNAAKATAAAWCRLLENMEQQS
jgi:hypothetical protein